MAQRSAITTAAMYLLHVCQAPCHSLVHTAAAMLLLRIILLFSQQRAGIQHQQQDVHVAFTSTLRAS
jgi:hypothetical protein